MLHREIRWNFWLPGVSQVRPAICHQSAGFRVGVDCRDILLVLACLSEAEPGEKEVLHSDSIDRRREHIAQLTPRGVLYHANTASWLTP